MTSRAFERRRLKVYVAGPISKGDPFENVMRGLGWGRRMLADGLAPYVPHLDAYLTLSPGTPPEDGTADSMWNALLEWDLEWVASSDALFRIAGESKGADLEVEVATALGLSIYAEEEYDLLLARARAEGLAGVRRR